MSSVDVAVIGAGTAGSLAAVMLGRAGYSTCLIDQAARSAPEFRCEKLEDGHVDVLRRAGLLEEVSSAGRRYDEIWIARLGHLAEKRARTEYGIDYASLVNRLRDLVPSQVQVITDKVVRLEPGSRQSTILLGSGGEVSARLVVMATGLNSSLFDDLGITRNVISRCHSVSIGFHVAPEGRSRFDFDALTYFGERPADKVSYLTLFPMGSATRANLFVYHDKGDPWFGEFRSDPVRAIHAALPRLHRLTGEFQVLDQPRLRPVDLVDAVVPSLPGLVLVGDAFSTACPVSGSGAIKAMVDAQRLCSDYVPRWLQGREIGAGEIAAFYRDPEKQRSDAHARHVSLFAKRLALEPGLGWTAYRWLRLAGSLGRNAVSRLSHTHTHQQDTAANVSPFPRG